MEGAHVSPRGKNKEERKEKKKRSSTISSKKGGGSKKYWEGIFPSIMYTWQDLNDNELVTVEVHMPSGSISSEFHLELEQDHPNEPQVLVIKYRVGACFLTKMPLIASSMTWSRMAGTHLQWPKLVTTKSLK